MSERNTPEKYWDAEMDAQIEPTPHEAYLKHCTPRVAQSIWDSVKSQAMKDYINALARLKDEPHDTVAINTLHECEEFFKDLGKLETVKKKLAYSGGMFECVAMEHFPTSWGEMLPTQKHTVKCPVCQDGRIGRYYRPVDKDAPIDPKNKRAKDKRILFSCDVCTYRYVFHVEGMEDEYLKDQAKDWKKIAIQQRNNLCRQETQEELKAHPEWNQHEIDLCYQRMAKKWHV